MEIYKEICEAREGYELFVKSYILKFIGIAVRHFAGATRLKEAPFRINRAKDMLKNTFRLIDENYSQELTLEQAVKASNFSVPHFCRLFRKFTGMTFGNYLAFYRVNRAEELLATSKSVTEIAYECGFGSLASFIRVFKRYKGLTPYEYRSGLKQNKPRNV
jgi:AraC-like DNA-binding protein